VISIKRCREILGCHAPVDDQEIENLRDQLYGVADVITEEILARTKRQQAADELSAEQGHDYNEYSKALGMLPEDERDDVEERAAIIEFEGQADREVAEKQAILATIRRIGQKRNAK